MLAMGEWKSQTARFPLFHSHDGDYGMIYPLNPGVYGIRILRARSQEKAPNVNSNQPKSYLSDLFSANNLPDVCLFFVGLAGVIVAVRTLCAMKHQVDTFTRKERARITVKISPVEIPSNTNVGSYPNTAWLPSQIEGWNFKLSITNSGETSAFIEASRCKACIQATGWNPREEDITSQIGLPEALPPHETIERSPEIEPLSHPGPRQGVNRENALDIAKGAKNLYVFGHIEFGDVFDNHWIVKFCWKWGGSGYGSMRGNQIFGSGWKNVDRWYKYPDSDTEMRKMNGEVLLQRPSLPLRIWRRMRREDPYSLVVRNT